MRRAVLWLGLGLALVAGEAGSQHPAAAAGDVPPGDAVITGRVLHPDGPESAAGLPLVLYALPAEGSPGVRTGETDAAGAFRFEGVSADPGTAYLVGTRYAEIPFGARFQFAEGEREHELTIAVSPSTQDAGAVVRGAASLRVDPTCSGLRVFETRELRNLDTRVIYVPKDARDTQPPILRGSLPGGSERFDAGFASLSEGIEFADGELRFWGPLYPGSQEIAFGYSLPAGEGGGEVALERGFPGGAAPLEVLSPASAPAPRALGNPLLAAPEQVRDGSRYRVLTAAALAPGEQLSLRFDVAPGARSEALSLKEAQLWLDLDAAAVSVDEIYSLEVAGDEALEGGPDGPLLCIPLPEGAVALRFSPSALAMGLDADPSGELAVWGPIPADTSQLALRYRLPVASEELAFERRFPLRVPLLSIMVADSGLRIESDRLHRRRPLRTEDRSFLHLEAFEVAPDEPVSLTLTPLPARRGPSARGAAGLLGVAAVLGCVFLIAPLRRAGPATAVPTPVPGNSLELEGIYAAIRDLDDDLETGKLTGEDHAEMRAELRSRALALLADQRSAAPAPPPASPACASCHAAVRPADVFCSQCGARLPGAQGGG